MKPQEERWGMSLDGVQALIGQHIMLLTSFTNRNQVRCAHAQDSNDPSSSAVGES